MKPVVAVVDSNSFAEAIHLIGGIDDLNTPKKKAVVKVGIYNVKTGICTTVKTIKAITAAFDTVKQILISESDSGAGLGMDRLQIWKDCYNDRIHPYNLSDDSQTKEVVVANETVPFSHVLLNSNTIVSTHVPRRYQEAGLEDMMNLGSILKNLLGLILDTKKHRFHKQLPLALIDMYEIIGGIDLAVIDGTRVYLGYQKKRTTVPSNVLLVGRDALAVEAVGLYLVGFDPLENPVLQEAKDRGLGETAINRIEIIGDIETPRKEVIENFQKLQR